MSMDATSASHASTNNATADDAPVDKGKGKKVVPADESMEEDEDDDDEGEEDGSDEEEEEEEDEDESLQEIDPSVILAPGARRSTRGVKVDYTSPEALAKAGLQAEDDEESDEDVEMKED